MKKFNFVVGAILMWGVLGLAVGGTIDAFIKITFSVNSDGVTGCIGLTLGVILGIFSGSKGPIRTVYGYLSAVLVIVGLVWLFGYIGFLGGKYLGGLVLGNDGALFIGYAVAFVGTAIALALGIINAVVLIRSDKLNNGQMEE